MRRARVDDNQREVVGALRDIGCSVQHLHAVGAGCPDILVGWRSINVLMEIKDGAKPPSARGLTDDQEKFHAAWNGQVGVVTSREQAINLMHDMTRGGRK